MDEYKHVFAKSTWVERQRALKRMTVVIEQLWEEGKISSTDPSEFTPIDIKEYFVFIKKKELSPKSIEHELGYINSLCEFFGNNCVKTARKRFPNLKTYKRRRRLPTMKYDLIFRIIDEGMKKDDYDSIRDYAVVILALCAGLRPVEMQHVPRDYIDLDEGEIYIDVMKGHGSYGEPRTVPIHPKGIPFLRKYLEIRDRSVEGSDYLFASRTHGRTISTNTLRKDKTNVENEIVCK
ncbi:MAG: site-specific integrase, partial [Methanomassiliicoccaceae archaeon]|nr:site-specific integrase [Methanomassiliicoccaceae archaeon]